MDFLWTFGRLSLERDGIAPPDWDKHRNGPAILAVLSAEGSASRDRLMALLWPESDSTRASGSLRQTLHQLRHLLDHPKAIRGERILSLDPAHIQSDIGQFRAALAAGDLGKAVELYQGPFLDGVHLGGPPEFESWVDEQRSALARDASRALRQLAQDAAAREDHHTRAVLLEHLTRLEPADGEVVLALMHAHAAGGDRAAALRAARDYHRRMQGDLGVAIDARVNDLAEQLRAAPHDVPASAWLPTLPAGEGKVPAGEGGMRPGEGTGPAAEGLVPRAVATPRRFPAWAVAGAAAGLLLAIAAARGLRAPAPAANPDLVAVAPFMVVDSSLELWREGVADLLIRELDGAGPLRTVAHAVTLKGQPAGLNRAAAAALGERTGAGIVVHGSVGRLAGDSIVLRAAVLDRTVGFTAEVEARGHEAQIAVLADSLVMEILKALARDRPLAATRDRLLGHSFGSMPLPALRAFLRGEQAFRQSDYTTALAHYRQVLAIDPNSPLALRRASQALGFGAEPGASEVVQYDLRLRAAALGRGLAPRDSLLFLSDSFYYAVPASRDFNEVAHNLAAVKSTLVAATGFYPHDPEIWNELGEMLYHLDPPFGSEREALAAFDRAIAIDSGFAPAFEHTVELAMRAGEPERAVSYLRAASRHRAGRGGPPMYLALLALDSGGASPAFQEALARASANDLYFMGAQYLHWASDSAEMALPALRLLALGHADPAGASPLLLAPEGSQLLVTVLAYRGHLAEAARVGTPLPPARWRKATGMLESFLELALFGAVPDSLARREFARGFDVTLWGGKPEARSHRHLMGAPWWYSRGDTLSLKRLASRGLEVSRTGEPAVAAPRGAYVHAAADAWLTLARGDSAGALRRFRSIPDTLCAVISCFHEKMALARLALAAGDARSSAATFEAWGASAGPSPSAVLAALDHARALEQLGEVVAARLRYRFVADAWRNADTVLAPHVMEARRGVERLSRES